MRVLILEDDPRDAAEIKARLTRSGYEVCGIASKLDEAYTMFDQLHPDISVVDIYLQGKQDGISYAQYLYDRPGTRHPFIFLTAAADRATFENARLTCPFTYLLKPFNELELQYAVELAVDKSLRVDNDPVQQGISQAVTIVNDIFFVKRGHTLAKIRASDITYIEVDGPYCILVHANEKFVVKQSMKQLHNLLPREKFIRIHRNFSVNISNIQKINLEDNEVVLQDGKSLSFSRRYMEDLIHSFYVLK